MQTTTDKHEQFITEGIQKNVPLLANVRNGKLLPRNMTVFGNPPG